MTDEADASPAPSEADVAREPANRTAKERMVGTILDPIRAMRREYLPLLLVYFAYGAQGVTGVAETFWVRDELALSGADLSSIAFWSLLPWTLKMVFGQLVDGVALFGSRRRAYVFVGAALCSASYVLLASIAGSEASKHALGRMYLASQVLLATGFMIQDVAADAMSTEVVRREGRTEEAVKTDLGMVQVLGRLALLFGSLVAAMLSGIVANTDHFTRSETFALGLVVPLLSVLGATFVRTEATEPGEVDPRVLTGGLVFAVFSAVMGYYDVPHGQEIVFLVSLVIVLTMLYLTVRDGDRDTLRRIAFTALIIFVFRAMPGSGEPVVWWETADPPRGLGFDEGFMGHLRTIGSLVAIATLWMGSGAITRRPIGVVLAGLTLIGFLVSLPIIGMAYGLHVWTEESLGFGARTIALVDTTVASPLTQLSMVPMLTLIAVHAPPGKRATWFALMASLMNLAMNAANLGTRYINLAIPVTRDDFSRVGTLLVVPTVIGLVLPLLVIALVGRRIQEPRKA